MKKYSLLFKTITLIAPSILVAACGTQEESDSAKLNTLNKSISFAVKKEIIIEKILKYDNLARLINIDIGSKNNANAFNR
jgi:uncharacterized lipoprotein YehR (DUF1307 family)